MAERRPVTVTRRFGFSAAHRYAGPGWSEAENRARFGTLAAVHGHNYVLEVSITDAPDPVTGIAVDLGELKRLVEETLLARFDHALLNDDPAFRDGVNPTAENLVRLFWDLLASKVGRDRLRRLRLAEDPTLWVDYHGEP